jgi:hypothetical protein
MLSRDGNGGNMRQAMAKENSQNWRFDRRITLSGLVQLVFLASLIMGSWINLQRQLDLLQSDVTYLCQCQENVEQKLESLWSKSISYEYRLRALENVIAKGKPVESGKTF